MKNTSLKSRLFALALLAVFVVTLFAPTRQAEASGKAYFFDPNSGVSGEVTPNNVNWNGGPQ